MTVDGFVIDFHVHTPASRCYSAREATATDITSAAVERGCDAIVVNDHHSAIAIDEVRDAARGAELAVFPGVEITTEHGHIVALFDRDTDCSILWALLRDLSIPNAQHGNGHFRIKPTMLETIDVISSAGGLPIPAHVDRWPNGFIEAQVDRRTRRQIHEHEAVRAIEITLPRTKDLWEGGRVPGLPRSVACIQGSDAHSPAEVGRRPTRVMAAEMRLGALCEAFARVPNATQLMEWR